MKSGHDLWICWSASAKAVIGIANLPYSAARCGNNCGHMWGSIYDHSAILQALTVLRKTHETEVLRRAALAKDATAASKSGAQPTGVSEPGVAPLDLPSIRNEDLPTVKLPRAEHCKVSTVTDNWPRGMHVSNLPHDYEDAADLSDKVWPCILACASLGLAPVCLLCIVLF